MIKAEKTFPKGLKKFRVLFGHITNQLAGIHFHEQYPFHEQWQQTDQLYLTDSA